MPRLSIVIPVLGRLKKLEDTLVSVLENRPAHSEIVVVLNEAYDDPYELAGEVRFLEAPARSDLIDCLNLGIASARSAIVHTLGCGVEVTQGWTDAAMRHFGRPQVAAVGSMILDWSQPERSLSTGLGYLPGGLAKRLGFCRPVPSEAPKTPAFFGPDLTAAFYRKSVVEALGGFRGEFKNSMAGLDLALLMHFAEQECIFEANCRVVADRSDLPEGERLGNGRQAERLFWRWASRMGWFRAGVGHVGLAANEMLESIVRPATIARLFGRAFASMWLPIGGRNEPKNLDIPQSPAIAAPHFSSMPVGKAS